MSDEQREHYPSEISDPTWEAIQEFRDQLYLEIWRIESYKALVEAEKLKQQAAA